MEIPVLSLFAVILIICVVLNIPIVEALIFGLILFLCYAKAKGFPFRKILEMSFSGIYTVRNVLITFLFIGSLTAVWRSSGCIPTIICYVSGFINSSIFIMLSFLLCALVSFLTGTSFGTAATVGVICMSIARSMNLSAFWVGGAILSGAYWGDRCSPVSTSALLVSTITDTDLYQNIRSMLKTAVLPTIFACIIYLAAGLRAGSADPQIQVLSLFQKEFTITWVCLIPAAAIFLLALCKVNVRIAMFVSVLCGIVISLLIQKTPLTSLFQIIVLGFQSDDAALASIINGGGLLSMVKVASIVCIASCYAGIFKETGLLLPLQEKVISFSEKTNCFLTIFLISIPASMIACNQTLSIMLVHQLSSKMNLTKEKLALYLENTVVLMAALIPWSIAGNVPLATVEAPVTAMAAAVYLYLLPLIGLVTSGKNRSSYSVFEK